MPADGASVTWQFAEKVRAPADDIFTQQVFDIRHNARIGEQVVHLAVQQMRRLDRVIVLSRSQHARQQFVEVTAVSSAFRFRENAYTADVTITIERRDLFARQCLWRGHTGLVKAELARQLSQAVGFGIEFVEFRIEVVVDGLGVSLCL